MAASHDIPTNPKNHSIVPRTANLRTLPIERANKDPNKQVIIPDLHGNVLKLIEELYFQNVLEITREDYAELVAIYYNSKPLTAAQKQQFDYIINNRIQVDPRAVRKIIFLGDETGDRGKNDYLMLRAFNLLAKENVNYEILLSNHGAEFLKFITYIETYPSSSNYMSRIQYIQCLPATSLIGLIRSLNDGVIQRSEVLSLFKSAYLPAAALLTCSVGGEKADSPVTVYTHARVGFETVSSLATLFEIPNKDKIETTYAKCRAIEAINQEYRRNLYNNIRVYEQQLSSCPRSVLDEDGSIPPLFSLVRLAWNRSFVNDTEIEKKDDRFFHGHVGLDVITTNYPSQFPQHTNLDISDLGKDYKGNAVVATSHNDEGLIYTLIKELNDYVTRTKESKDVVEASLVQIADRIRRYLLRENFSVDFPENVEFTPLSATEENRLVQHDLFKRIKDILEQTKIIIPGTICPTHLLALPLRIKTLEAQKDNLDIHKANIQKELTSFQTEAKTSQSRASQSIKDEIKRNTLEILRIKQELHNQKLTTRIGRFLNRNRSAIAGVLIGGTLTGIFVLAGIVILPITVVALSITYATCGGLLGHAIDAYRRDTRVAIAPTPASLTTPAATDPQPPSSGSGHTGINAGLGITPQNEHQVAAINPSSIMLTPTPSGSSSEHKNLEDNKDETKTHSTPLRPKKTR